MCLGALLIPTLRDPATRGCAWPHWGMPSHLSSADWLGLQSSITYGRERCSTYIRWRDIRRMTIPAPPLFFSTALPFPVNMSCTVLDLLRTPSPPPSQRHSLLLLSECINQFTSSGAPAVKSNHGGYHLQPKPTLPSLIHPASSPCPRMPFILSPSGLAAEANQGARTLSALEGLGDMNTRLRHVRARDVRIGNSCE